MLDHRSTLPELMDGPSVPASEIHQALRELEVVGKRLGGYNVAINAINKLFKEGKSANTIMDVGCGGGDTLRVVADWARSHNKDIRFIGIDRNPEMTQYSAAHSTGYANIRYITADVFDDSLLSIKPDVVMSSLFCHHFDGSDLVRLLQRMHMLCSTAVIVNDLHRHPIAYHSIRLLTRIFSKSYLVKYDAPLSVARAFKRQDWQYILPAAGIKLYSLRWNWAWRWQLIIPKQ